MNTIDPIVKIKKITKVTNKEKIIPPKEYQVILLNGHQPFEVVHETLMNVFSLSWPQAQNKAMEAHRIGRSVLLITDFSNATKLTTRATEYSSSLGWEVHFSIEEN